MNTSVSSLIKPISSAIVRYHSTLFIVFIVGLLSVAVFLLSLLLAQDSSDTSASDQSVAQTYAFQKDKTITKVNELRSSSEQTQPLELPKDRRNNAFVE